MVRGLVRQKERVAEAEQHHSQVLTKWQEEEARIKGETTALLSTKTRLQTGIKVYEGKIAKQKEILHDQVCLLNTCIRMRYNDHFTWLTSFTAMHLSNYIK